MRFLFFVLNQPTVYCFEFGVLKSLPRFQFVQDAVFFFAIKTDLLGGADTDRNEAENLNVLF